MAVFTEHGHACVQVLFVREFRRTWTQQIQPDQTAY